MHITNVAESYTDEFVEEALFLCSDDKHFAKLAYERSSIELIENTETSTDFSESQTASNEDFWDTWGLPLIISIIGSIIGGIIIYFLFLRWDT